MKAPLEPASSEGLYVCLNVCNTFTACSQHVPLMKGVTPASTPHPSLTTIFLISDGPQNSPPPLFLATPLKIVLCFLHLLTSFINTKNNRIHFLKHINIITAHCIQNNSDYYSGEYEIGFRYWTDPFSVFSSLKSSNYKTVAPMDDYRPCL